jgi:membrane peptidoglycan carboxypeptidase
MPVGYTGGPWPKNDNRRYNYARTIYSGIVSSVNAISVRTLQLIGYEYGFSFAKYNFGQNSLTEDYPLANGQSLNDLGAAPLALGALTVGATVREMSAAYATFPNGGTYREPRLFTKVYNSDGELVIDNVQDSRTILSEKTANYMNYCLYNAATHGTGAAATMPGQNIAGKTGTTSSNRDRWFCGYTSHYTAAVWCGYNKPEQIYLTGNTANPAARLWRMVMMPVHEGLPNEGLFNGNAFRSVGVCLDSGKLATAACKSDVRGDRVSYANCYPEDIPSGTCSKHVSVEYCVTGGGVATEYCSMFADVEIASRSLVKLTQAEVNEIRNAISAGLVDIYYDDGYVYYLGSGDGEAWHGFRDDYPDNDRPYLLCPTHTKEAWEEYQAEQEATEGTGPDDGMWGDGEGEGGSGNEGGNAGSDDDDMWA